MWQSHAVQILTVLSTEGCFGNPQLLLKYRHQVNQSTSKNERLHPLSTLIVEHKGLQQYVRLVFWSVLVSV